MAYSWLPTTADVALYVAQRVSDATGDFTASTVPSAAKVTSLIALAAEDVYAAVGDVDLVDPTLVNAARHVTALGAAVEIERSFTSNEAEERSPRLDSLQSQYEKALKRLQDAAQYAAGSDVPDAVYGFPDITSATSPVPATTWTSDF